MVQKHASESTKLSQFGLVIEEKSQFRTFSIRFHPPPSTLPNLSQPPALLKLQNTIASTITISQSLHKISEQHRKLQKGGVFVSLHSDSKPPLSSRTRRWKINVATIKFSAKRREHSKAIMEMAWNRKC